MNKFNFIIADPCLIDYKGHYFQYDKSLYDALKEFKNINKISILSNKAIMEELKNEMDIIETFSHDIFVESNSQKVGNEKAYENFNLVNEIFRQDMEAYSQKYLTNQNDIIFFPNLNQNQLLGILNWLENIDVTEQPKILITLRYLNSHMEYNKVRGLSEAILNQYSEILSQLKTNDNVRFITDTNALSEFYHSLSGIEIASLPIPHTYPNKISTDSEELPILISQLGTWSKYKGASLILESMETILVKNTKVNFFIQIDDSLTQEEKIQVEKLNNSYADRIIFHYGVLTNDEYHSRLSKTNILLLSYMPEHYAYQSSGVLAEAASLGKVFVTTKDTFMHEQSKQFYLGAVIMNHFNTVELINATNEAINNYHELKAKAENGKENFINYHNAKNFIKEILQIV